MAEETKIRRRWIWILFTGLFFGGLSMIAGFTTVIDHIFATEALTPILLNKEYVFGTLLVISFGAVGLAQHFLAKLNREEVSHHINIP